MERLFFGWWLLALVGGVLRSVTLSESLWLDELHTAWVVNGPWSAVAARAAEGNQNPVYFWIVSCVVRFCGHSEVALRSVSLLSGMLLVFFAARLGLLWTGSRGLSTLIAALIVIDPHCVYFSREARPYAFLQLLVVWHLWAFSLRWLSGNDRGRWTWVVTAILLFYTHVTGCLILAAEWIFLVWHGWRINASEQTKRVWSDARVWIGDTLVVAFAYAWAIPSLRLLAERRSNWLAFVRDPDLSNLVTMFAWIPYGLVPALVLAAMASISRPSLRLSKSPLVFWTSLTLLWYWVPAFLTWGATKAGVAPLFFRRYVMGSAVAWPMLPACLGAFLSERMQRAGFALLVFIAAVITHAGRSDEPYTRHSWEDWRGAIAWIDSRRESRLWPVFLRSGLIEDQHAGTDRRAIYQEYLRFPLRSFYAYQRDPADAFIIPRLWSGDDRFSWDAVRHAGGCILLARGDAKSLGNVQEQLRTAAQREHLELHPLARFDAGRILAIEYRATAME